MSAQDYACYTPLVDVCNGIADPRIFSMVIADCCREIVAGATVDLDATTAAKVHLSPKENQTIVFATIYGRRAFNHPVRGGAFTQRYEYCALMGTFRLRMDDW